MSMVLARSWANDVARIVAGIALVYLGALSLLYRDTLLQWQPLPISIPDHDAIAVLSGLLLIVAGAGVVVARRSAAIVAAGWIGLWAIALHLPRVAMHPSVVTLLGFAESGGMAIGLATLARFARDPWPDLLRIAFGCCLLVYGASHFAYPAVTASMVPEWLPFRFFLACLTGAIHAGAGLALLLRFHWRTAATIEALMMTSFVVLLHIPGLAHAPTDRAQLTMLGIATLLTSAAWLVATIHGQSFPTNLGQQGALAQPS